MIRTQRVEVAFENPEDAFECKNRLAEVCKSKLLPAMEKLFDQKITSKQIFSIDQLYVDAGQLDGEDWEDRLVETVIRRLRQYLDEVLVAKNTGKKGGEPEQHEVSFIDSSSEVKSKGGIIREAGEEAETLLYFLQHGVLPWYATLRSQVDLRQQFTQLMTSFTFIQSVKEMVFTSEVALERLVYHFGEDTVFAIVSKDKASSATLRKLKRSWHRIFSRLGIPSFRQQSLFFRAICRALEKNSVVDPEMGTAVVTREILTLMTQRERTSLLSLVHARPDLQFTPEESRIIRYISQHEEEWIQGSAVGSSIHQEKDQLPGAELSKERSRIVADEENPVYITNAGLVLLHPFLSSLFENVGYKDKSGWVSEETHARSLLLTQYLVTGGDEYPEFDLFLNKLLTGYPLDTSLPVDTKLSAFEQTEAADLLQAVINHWRALKNTSVPGLQTTFLQREGKIIQKESGWLLQVEQKAFDILLDKIPWGFSTIKTPWMDEILSVEWA
jgi:hypothetical protein